MAIRVVVVGLGPRGRDWVRQIQSDPAFQLVAAVDIDRDVLQQTASLGIPAANCFPTLDEALDRTSCDAVIVATTVGQHEEACLTAIAHRLAVLVEKPFTMHLDTALRLVCAAEEKGLPLIVGQNHRYLRSWRTVHRLIAEDVLGRLGLVTCHYYRPPHRMAAALASLENNVLWGYGVHQLDALRYVLSQRITRVSADLFSRPQIVKGASMQAILMFEEGTRAVVTASYESSGHEFFERGQEFYARFVGDRATLHVFQRWLFLCEGRKLPRPIARGARREPEERLLLRQLARAILHGEQPDCSGRDNLQTMAAVEACVRSSAERRWINPQELLP